MLPKSSKHYVGPTAEELELNQQFVEDVVSFYYGTLRRTLTDLKSYNVQVENLGSFKIKKKELPKLAAKYTKHLSVLTKDTFTQMQIRKDVSANLEKVIQVQAIISEDRERRKEHLKRKYVNITKNMEQS